MNVIQNINKHLRGLSLIVFAWVLLAYASVSIAKDYQVEVLVFANKNASAAAESHDYFAPRPMRSNSNNWVLDPTLLLEEAETIKKSSDYELKHHYAWGQQALPYSRSTTYTVIDNDIKGYIKVYADSLLFANIDLDFEGFRMQEKRRLKLNERHFFDHPKFGILMQVSRLEPVEPSADTGSQSEPQNDNSDEPEDDRLENLETSR